MEGIVHRKTLTNWKKEKMRLVPVKEKNPRKRKCKSVAQMLCQMKKYTIVLSLQNNAPLRAPQLTINALPVGTKIIEKKQVTIGNPIPTASKYYKIDGIIDEKYSPIQSNIIYRKSHKEIFSK